MDVEKIKKLRPVIAAVVALGILGFWLLPKFFHNTPKVTASGTVEITEVDVSSRISSRITTLEKDEGQEVKKGETMADLDDSIVAAQKDAAAAVFVNARDIYNRSKNLFDTQSISQQQFDSAQAAFVSAQAQLKEAQVMLDEAAVKAPWSGIILKKHVEAGELVSPGSPLFTIGDLSQAKVTIYVPLTQMTMIKYGMKALVEIDAYKGRKFEGKVTFISGEAEFTPKNVQTQDERIKEVFEVQITVPNPEGILKPGIPADVDIQI
ncbi:MAG: efflux RND transporter periplasmic adaptor subunit [Candidatus Goldiibacteriota bacterium]|jgi:HlyD family secretion protein